MTVLNHETNFQGYEFNEAIEIEISGSSNQGKPSSLLLYNSCCRVYLPVKPIYRAIVVEATHFIFAYLACNVRPPIHTQRQLILHVSAEQVKPN
jgi:hypothetical protein